MLTNFIFHAPAYVVSERNSSQKVGYYLNEWGAKKNVMLVCDKQLLKLSMHLKVLESIYEFGFNVIVFDNVLPNAPVDTIREGIEIAKEKNISAVVALGGGSSIDTAKSIALMLNKNVDILDYCKNHAPKNKRSVLLFAIPTTCGTGSETTDIGVIYEPETNYKHIYFDQFAGPDLAILDPILLYNLPPNLIAATALDAFSHSAEAYTSRNANIMMAPLALESMSLVYNNVHKAVQSPPDLNALEKILIASTMAGIAFTQVGLHIGHAISHGISVYGNVHHGVACALALPYALESISEDVPDRIVKIGKLMNLTDLELLTPKELGATVSNAIINLNKSLNINCLSDYGVKESMFENIADYAINEKVTQSNSFRSSPKKEVIEYLKKIYR
jgi:alcohol dehydrogenase class IV